MQSASLFGRLAILFGLAFALTAAPPLRAQTTGELPAGGKNELDTNYSKYKGLIGGSGSLVTGQEQYNPDKHKEAVSVLAKYHTYRLTLAEARQPGAVNNILAGLDADLNKMGKNRDKTQPVIEALGKEVINLQDDMLTNREPLARVNYMRELLRFGQEGIEEVVDPMIKVLDDPAQNDGAKYWALQGLRELFLRAHQVPPTPFKDRKREAAAILALIKFVERPVNVSLMPEEEVEGVRVLRREAVKALALTRYPAVVNDKKEVVGRTAQLLARVVAKEGFTPAVQLDEQVEAAIGLCRMQDKLYPDYQPDAAARFVGLAVAELANASGVETKDRGWKVYGARVGEALAALKADTAAAKGLGEPSKAYVNRVVQGAEDLARKMEKGSTADPKDFRNMLQQNPPPTEQIYKSLPDSVVKVPAE